MNNTPDDLSTFQIRIHRVDGLTKTFVLDDPEKIDSALITMDASLVFARDSITIADDASEITLPTAHLTRIDLITNRLSVWDFPLVVGAPTELTEAEFLASVANPKESEPNQYDDLPVFLNIVVAQQQSLFLCMEVVGGLPAVRLSRIESMLRGKSLVFGLQANGIGILNLSHLTHFSIHPKPMETFDEISDAREKHGGTTIAANFEVDRQGQGNGEPHFIRVTEDGRAH